MSRSRWGIVVLAALALAPNVPALTRLARSGCRMASSWRDGFRSASEQVDAARRMAACVHDDGKSVAYCQISPRGLFPIERSRVLAMSWATMPEPVRSGDPATVVGSDAIVVTEFEPKTEKRLSADGYAAVASGGGVNLWVRGGSVERPTPNASIAVLPETLSTLFVIVLFLAGLALGGRTGFACSLVVVSIC